ncbi:MAG TPA: cation diffusion facilitator family transporter [bacterium]|nr:cation diffusion facilitator family transporter [bacterium]
MIESKGQRVLGITFLFTLAFCIFEFIGGKISGSLALIADAGHMLTDLGAIGLAFFAGHMASRQATARMSYGFYRIEVLSALVNGAALLTLAVFIVLEGFHRMAETPVIHTQVMIVVGLAGLVFDIISGFFLSRYAGKNINIRGAFFHVMSDALGSVGTVAAGVIIAVTGWRYADPLVSFFIALLIVVSAWRLLKDVVQVLLEATPSRINIQILENRMLSLPGIQAIHDLHVWSISPGKESLSAHLQVEEGTDRDKILHELHEILSRDFQIDHTTLQIETREHRRKEKSHFH